MSTTPLPDPSNQSSDSLVHAPGVGLVQVAANTPDAHLASAIDTHQNTQQQQQSIKASDPTPANMGGGLQPTVVADPNQSYSLGQAPRFLRDTLPMDQIKVEPGSVYAMTGVGAEHRKATAYVSPKAPLSIQILDPKTFQQAQLNHELTHTYQDRLPKDISFAPVNPSNLYGYGGPEGLAKNADPRAYSKEQMARIVENHEQKTQDILQKAKSGKLYQEDVDDYRKWQAAAGPLIKNFAALSGKKYEPHAADPKHLYDLPEISDRNIEIPDNLQRRPVPTAADPHKVTTGLF